MRLNETIKREIVDSVVAFELGGAKKVLDNARLELGERVYDAIVPEDARKALSELPVNFKQYVGSVVVDGFDVFFNTPKPVPIQAPETTPEMMAAVNEFQEAEQTYMHEVQRIEDLLQQMVFDYVNTTDQLIKHWHGVVRFCSFYDDVMERSIDIEANLHGE